MARDDKREVDRVFRRLEQEIMGPVVSGAFAGLVKAGSFLKAESQKLCPVDLGNLRASAYLVVSEGAGAERSARFKNSPDKSDIAEKMDTRHQAVVSEAAGSLPMHTVEIGYSAVYAMSVHENPRAGKTGGVLPKENERYAARGGSINFQRRSWATHGQWKFLEQPAKQHARQISSIISGTYRQSHRRRG